MNVTISGTIKSCNNKPWPPRLGSTIAIAHPEYNDIIFLGFIYKYLSNFKGAIVILLNDTKYVDSLMIKHKFVPNRMGAQGLFLLQSHYGWKYINDQKLSSMTGKTIDQIDQIKYNLKHEFDNNIVLNDYPITQLDLTTEGLYNKNNEQDKKMCKYDDDGIQDESILRGNDEVDLDKLFKEQNANIYDPNEKFTPLDPKLQLLLKKKLQMSERENDEKTRIIINKNIALRNIIKSKDDEINEGGKIINWIGKNIQNIRFGDKRLFDDLKMAIHNGYVFIGRKGIDVNDYISKDLVPNLHYYGWQYGIPINYDTLKYILFQNSYQKSLESDVKQRKEIENILSQEYQICLQPEPKYVMYTLKRLILAWYTDDYLIKNIRKIKVLINQWRAKSDEPYNKKYGIQPMIVIYPRYGKASARICVDKIASYFSLYNNMAWKCSVPSYFIKVNDLMYYTNGHLDLKLYFRQVLKNHHGNITNESFENDLSKVLNAENVLLFE